MPKAIRPIIAAKKKIVPELNGNPKVLTNNNSIFPERSTVHGIITYIIIARIRIEIIPAIKNPLLVVLYFLK